MVRVAPVVVDEEVGRVVVVEVAGRVVGRGATVLGRDTEVLFSAVVEPAILDRLSTVLVGFAGARVAGVPTSDIRFAVLDIPRFSSPELATDRDFSSAELLTDARDRWEAVADVLSGFRVVVVVGGRVGGLFNVPPLAAEGREVDVVGLGAPDMELGRFVAGVPETGRLVAVELLVGLFLVGEAFTFSLSLETSGLVTGSSLPESTVESTGVAGGASESTTPSAGATGGTGSSVEAIVASLGSKSGTIIGQGIRSDRSELGGLANLYGSTLAPGWQQQIRKKENRSSVSGHKRESLTSTHGDCNCRLCTFQLRRGEKKEGRKSTLPPWVC